MTVERLVIHIFGTYYISLCVSSSHVEGPWSILTRLRDSELFRNDDWRGRGIRCIVCVSLYVSALLSLIACVARVVTVRDALLLVPAGAGGAVLIDKVWKR